MKFTFSLKKSLRKSYCCLYQSILIVGVITSCNKSKIREVNRNKKRPNILFAIADDQSFPYAPAYGTKGIYTPSFDKVAKEGVLFLNAFAAAPQCSPSRAAILAGKNIWELQEAGTNATYFPKMPVFTDILDENGYRLGYTGKAWAPGNWKDAGWARNPVGDEYNELQLENASATGISPIDYFEKFKDFLSKRTTDEPFFFWYGGHEPHRVYEYGSGKKSGRLNEEIFIPPFLPDTPIVRNDVNDYILEIEWFDSQLGKMLDYLSSLGELDNTIIIVTADNGMPFPYAKANLQEQGTHVPLAISWPKGIKDNVVASSLTSLIDLAPTLLSLARMPGLEDISGKDFSKELLKSEVITDNVGRKYVFTGRERHTHARPDNLGYPARAIRSKDYLYVYNYKADRWPAGNPVPDKYSGDKGDSTYKPMHPGYHDIDDSPSKALLQSNQLDYEIYFNLGFSKRPTEQFYNLTDDPYCINNLAFNSKWDSLKSKHRQLLLKKLELQNDPRTIGDSIFESDPRFSKMRKFKGFKKQGEYNEKYFD